MTDDSSEDDLAIRDPPKILIPVQVLEGQTIPGSLVEFLAPAEIVVLGYHVLPEQTPTEQASMQFEDRARSAVEDIAHTFHEAGRDVETRVVFTHDRDQTVERTAAEVGATAILLPNPTGDIENVLVAIQGAIDADRLADLVATLVGDGDRTVTLWGIGPEGTGPAIDDALEAAHGTLLDRGLAASRITAETNRSETPTYDIVDRSGEFDVIVMGEGEETLLSAIVGEDAERVAEGAVSPVLVVRSRPVEE